MATKINENGLSKIEKEIKTSIEEKEDDKEVQINALKLEISVLKKKLSECEEDIDDLVVERDEEVKLVYELRLKLADAWNIEFATDAEKVREVYRLTEKMKKKDHIVKRLRKQDKQTSP